MGLVTRVVELNFCVELAGAIPGNRRLNGALCCARWHLHCTTNHARRAARLELQYAAASAKLCPPPPPPPPPPPLPLHVGCREKRTHDETISLCAVTYGGLHQNRRLVWMWNCVLCECRVRGQRSRAADVATSQQRRRSNVIPFGGSSLGGRLGVHSWVSIMAAVLCALKQTENMECAAMNDECTVIQLPVHCTHVTSRMQL
jgi:hypothetical protein